MPATLSSDPNKSVDHCWDRPEDTTLGRYFAEGSNDGLSGVFLLDDPRLALMARVSLADQAEHTLDLQYYLWQDDTSGTLLLARALDAADRGVRVRLLIDDIYHSGRDDIYAAIDAHPNVSIRVFNPIGRRFAGRGLHFVINKGKLNSRMHNKIFLVDGAVAVLGGRNIGDEYFGVDPRLSFHDLDVLAAGGAAVDAGAAYDMYWNSEMSVPIAAIRRREATETELKELRTQIDDFVGEPDDLPYAFPRTEAESAPYLAALRRALIRAPAEIIVDPLERFRGPSVSVFIDLGREIINSIEREVVVQTAYLIPTRNGIDALASLTGRGVRVRMLTNSLMSNNHLPVHAHYAKYRKQLIRAGAELHEFRCDAALLSFLRGDRFNSPAGLHTKAAVVDRRFTLIGSYNMDPRSRNLNSEIGLLVRSEEFAARVLEAMERDFDPTNSYRLYLEDDRRLRWEAASQDGVRVYTSEPEASFARRLSAALIRLIPVEDEL